MSIADTLPHHGRLPRPLTLEVLRELTAADISRLGSTEAEAIGVPTIQKLRATHHRQAILLARGLSATDVASIVGSTPERVRQLQRDPQFRNLLASYEDSERIALLEESARAQERLADVHETVMLEIQQRVHDDEKLSKMPIYELRKLAEMTGDRSVAPPKNALPLQALPQAITLNIGTAVVKVPGDDAKPAAVIENEPATGAAESTESATGSQR